MELRARILEIAVKSLYGPMAWDSFHIKHRPRSIIFIRVMIFIEEIKRKWNFSLLKSFPLIPLSLVHQRAGFRLCKEAQMSFTHSESIRATIDYRMLMLHHDHH